MNAKIVTRIIVLAGAGALVAGCSTQQGTNTAVGAGATGALGAAIGGAVGGAQGAAIGGATGLAVGATLGHYWDDISNDLFGSSKGTKAAVTSDNKLKLGLSGDETFASGKATLLAAAYPQLDQIAQEMKKHPELSAEVVGFTDNTGSAAANQRLSLERAQAVAGYLTEQGVPSARVTASGHGALDPIADNSTPQGRAQNRRVELYLHSTGANN